MQENTDPSGLFEKITGKKIEEISEIESMPELAEILEKLINHQNNYEKQRQETLSEAAGELTHIISKNTTNIAEAYFLVGSILLNINYNYCAKKVIPFDEGIEKFQGILKKMISAVKNGECRMEKRSDHSEA